MGKHVLLTINPWVEENNQGPFYCPDCGMVEGFFSYSPEIRKKIDIITVDFQKPRQKVIEFLGQENQGCPVLVIDDDTKAPEGAKKSMTTGKAFIDDPRLICDYLGKIFKVVRPHP